MDFVPSEIPSTSTFVRRWNFVFLADQDISDIILIVTVSIDNSAFVNFEVTTINDSRTDVVLLFKNKWTFSE